MVDLQSLPTAELKTLIRRRDEEQEEAVLELMTRHDAGDLVIFFSSLAFQPRDVNEFIRRAKQLRSQNSPRQARGGVQNAVIGAAVGLSPAAVHQRDRRTRLSEVSGRSTPVPLRDKPDTSNVISLEETRPARRKYESSCGMGIDTRPNGEQYSYQRVAIPNVLSGRLFATRELVEAGKVDLSQVDTDRLFDLIELLQTVYRKVNH